MNAKLATAIALILLVPVTSFIIFNFVIVDTVPIANASTSNTQFLIPGSEFDTDGYNVRVHYAGHQGYVGYKFFVSRNSGNGWMTYEVYVGSLNQEFIIEGSVYKVIDIGSNNVITVQMVS